MTVSNNLSKASRLEWVDNIKALACSLVVLGHLIISFDGCGIYPFNDFTLWFRNTIYLFHVPLFFLCSGFLYAYSVKNKGREKYPIFVLKKFLALGIPYFTFTIIKLAMKLLAGDFVNSVEDGFFQTLFLHPTAPYWYLYALFFMFLIIPPVKSKKQFSIVFAISLAMRIAVIFGILVRINFPVAVDWIMRYSIWFVLGMGISVFDYKAKKSHTIAAVVGLVLFIVLSIVRYGLSINDEASDFLMGVIAVLSIFVLYSSVTVKTGMLTKLLIKYNLPLFLMHSIFASSIRIVLIKLGIDQWYIHIPVGLLFTFAGPMLAGFIMEKSKYLEFFLYPLKFIKISDNKRNNSENKN